VRANRPLLLSLLSSLTLLLATSACYGPVGLDPRGDDDDDDDDSAPDDDDGADDDDAVDDDDDDDDDAGDDDISDPFEIDEIDPNDGSTDGGYNAEIFYSGDLSAFEEDDIEVLFGEAEAEVLALTDDKILVEVPAGCSFGEVEVTVEIADDQDDEVDFEYEAAGVGLDGAVFGVFRSEVPAYPGNETGAVELGFFEPTDSPPLTHLPPLGTCSYNIVPGNNPRDYYKVADSLSISAGVPINTNYDGSLGTYSAAALPTAVPNNGTYTILDTVDQDSCELSFPGVVSSPAYLNITVPMISSTEFADCWFMLGGYGVIEWDEPFSNGDFVFVTLSNAEYADQPSVTCHYQDQGYVLLQEADMVALTPGLHTLGITRYRVTETTHPRNGSTMHGVYADSRNGFIFVYPNDYDCGY
jgi:hypothetical protein